MSTRIASVPVDLIDIPAELDVVVPSPSVRDVRAYRRAEGSGDPDPNVARSPVVLAQRPHGRYDVLRGVRRLKMARRAGVYSILAEFDD